MMMCQVTQVALKCHYNVLGVSVSIHNLHDNAITTANYYTNTKFNIHKKGHFLGFNWIQ